MHAVHSEPKKFNDVNKNSNRKQPSKFESIAHQKTGKQKECGRYGTVHGPQCPAMGLLCYSCGRKNHFKKKCYFQNRTLVHTIHQGNESGCESDAESEFFVDSIDSSINSSRNSQYGASLKINGKFIKYKLDTGSDVNILSMRDFKTLLRKPKIHSSNIKLICYSGDKISTYQLMGHAC